MRFGTGYINVLCSFIIVIFVQIILFWAIDIAYSLLIIASLSIIPIVIQSHHFLQIPKERFNFFFAFLLFFEIFYLQGFYIPYYKVSSTDIQTWDAFLNMQNINNHDVALSFIVINVFGLFFYFLGVLIQPIYNDIDYEEIFRKYKKQFYILIFCLSLYEFLLITGGVMSIQGEFNAVDKGNKVNPYLAFVTGVFQLAVIPIGYYFRYLTKENRIIKIVLVFSILVQLVFFFMNGRRMQMFFFVNLAVGYWINDKITFRLLRKKIVPIVVSGFILFSLTQVYQLVRFSGALQILQKNDWATIVEIYDMVSLVDAQDFKQSSSVNLILRPFASVAGFATVLHYHANDMASFAYGISFKNSVLVNTPSDVFVDKSHLPIQEELLSSLIATHPYFEDLGDTIIAESYLDFGFFGGIVYPILILICFVPLYWLVRNHKFLKILLFVNGFAIAISMSEGATITLLNQERSIAVWLIVYLILSKIKFNGKHITIK